MENDIRVFILMDGTEIVTHVLSEDEDGYQCEFPMKVLTKYIASEQSVEGSVDVDAMNMMVPWINSVQLDVPIFISIDAIMVEAPAAEFCVEEWMFQTTQALNFHGNEKTQLAASEPTVQDQVQSDSNILSFRPKDSER